MPVSWMLSLPDGVVDDEDEGVNVGDNEEGPGAFLDEPEEADDLDPDDNDNYPDTLMSCQAKRRRRDWYILYLSLIYSTKTKAIPL